MRTAVVLRFNKNSDLILRSSRAIARERLEGWPHTSCMEINVIYAGEVINACAVIYASHGMDGRKCHVMYGEDVTYDKNVIYDARGVSR